MFFGTQCRIIVLLQEYLAYKCIIIIIILSVRCLQMLCSTDKVTFILGDFNLPDIDWSQYHAPDNIIYNTILNFVNSYGLTQFVKQSTRDNNILDLVLSTSVKIISNIDILPPIGTSDHNVIVFLILIQLTLLMSITLLTIHSLIGHMLTMI